MVEKTKEKVAGMFNQISGTYDLANHLLSLGMDFRWRKKVAAELEKYRPQSVLDLACGTCDLALAIKKQIPQSFVLGIDLAEKMLALAAAKTGKSDAINEVSLAKADIERMPFPDQSFNAASIAFGIRNLERRDRGLLEIRRVLKPGGVLAVLEFSMPKKGLFAAVYSFYLGKLLPMLGRLISGKEAYFYLRDTIREFPGPGQFSRELENAGFGLKDSIRLSRGAVFLYIAQK